MRKSQLIKFLEKLPGDPEVGLNVLTDVGSEFWGLAMQKVKLTDNGSTVSLGQVRLRKSLPVRALLKIDTPGVDSYDVEPETLVDRFLQRYDMEEIPSDLPWEQLAEIMLTTIRDDMRSLVRMNDDFLRICNDPKLTQRFKV